MTFTSTHWFGKGRYEKGCGFHFVAFRNYRIVRAIRETQVPIALAHHAGCPGRRIPDRRLIYLWNTFYFGIDVVYTVHFFSEEMDRPYLSSAARLTWKHFIEKRRKRAFLNNLGAYLTANPSQYHTYRVLLA